MNLFTCGREFYTKMKMPLWYNPAESFLPELSNTERFRLVLIEEGTGILRLAELRLVFNAPALFCLNETEQPQLEHGIGLRARSLFFHPKVINSMLDFENIRGKMEQFPETALQDRDGLRAFIRRPPNYHGQLQIGPGTASRIANLVSIINRELTTQPDNYWPCRSRSFFLELLFLVDRVYRSPQSVTVDPLLNQATDGMEQVILYLHTHYQRKITISELTKTFNINRTTLTERFAATTRQPVMTYLIGLRLRVAAMMLHDTMLPVAEITERVGFGDITHFGRMFKRNYGCSPSEYRERFCWMRHD